MEFIEGAQRLRGSAKALDIWRMETKIEVPWIWRAACATLNIKHSLVNCPEDSLGFLHVGYRIYPEIRTKVRCLFLGRTEGLIDCSDLSLPYMLLSL